MRNKTIVLLMLFLCICSFLLGSFISNQKCRTSLVEPYLADLSRDLIFVAILQNENRLDSNDSVKLAYEWFSVAKGMELESESVAAWLKTYEETYGLPGTMKLDPDIQAANSYIFKGAAKHSLLDSIEQGFTARKK
jgi:hypothetical protein